MLGALLALTACGDSSVLSAPQAGLEPRIETFAGTGNSGLGAEGVDPRKSELYLPQDVTIGPAGRAYILDWNNHRIRVVEEGVIRTLVGSGGLGDAPAGPALEVSFNHPTHVTFDPLGRLVISAWHNSKILRYDFLTERVEPICGTGVREYNGDGIPATEAWLNLPSSTAFDSFGRMYISDQESQRVRRVDLDGLIYTVVGTGEAGFAGDGGPATAAMMRGLAGQAAPPTSRIALDRNDNLYLADTFNNRIRKVGIDGIITTIAGTGFDFRMGGETDLGEYGSALSAALSWPCDIALDAQDRLFIADTFNHCIRRIDADGQIATVAGQCGVQGFAGDGGDPQASLLNRPYGIDLDADGNLYIADTKNQRIRVVYF